MDSGVFATLYRGPVAKLTGADVGDILVLAGWGDGVVGIDCSGWYT